MLTAKELLGRAQALEPQLVEWRRTLHRHPEVGFDPTQTKALVKKALTEMGYEPKDCGKAGIIALAGGKRPGKTILLRGDMDALPIQEESGVDYASEVPGKMQHGCGHDMHTAMMLGAAQLLKEHEDEIEGTVKLEFQPAEEIFQGSPDMIANGLLEKPQGGCGSHVPCAGRNAHPRRCGAGACLRRHYHGQLRAVSHRRPRQGRPRLHAGSVHRPHYGRGPYPHCIAGDQQPGAGCPQLWRVHHRPLPGRRGLQCHPGHRRDVGHHPHHRTPRAQ